MVNVGYGDPSRHRRLPDAAVKERATASRPRSPIPATSFDGPHDHQSRAADVKKEGPSFDLPIAVGMLAASEQIETDQLDHFVIVGELALTGAVAAMQRRFCQSPFAQGRRQNGNARAGGNAAEAAVVAGLQVIPGSELARGRAVSRR